MNLIAINRLIKNIESAALLHHCPADTRDAAIPAFAKLKAMFETLQKKSPEVADFLDCVAAAAATVGALMGESALRPIPESAVSGGAWAASGAAASAAQYGMPGGRTVPLGVDDVANRANVRAGVYQTLAGMQHSEPSGVPVAASISSANWIMATYPAAYGAVRELIRAIRSGETKSKPAEWWLSLAGKISGALAATASAGAVLTAIEAPPVAVVLGCFAAGAWLLASIANGIGHALEKRSELA
jgi:hypothetical protein